MLPTRDVLKDRFETATICVQAACLATRNIRVFKVYVIQMATRPAACFPGQAVLK
jgi:hypothetical protein